MKLQRISIAKNASLSYINTNKFKTEALGLSLSIPLTPRDYLCNMLLSGIMRRGTESMPSHAAVNRALDMLYAAVVEISSNTCANTLSLNVGADFLADRHVPEGEDVFGGVIGIIGELLTAPKKQDGVFPADTLRSEIAIVRDALLAERNNTRAYAAMRCRELLHRDNPNYPTLEYLLENIETVSSDELMAYHKKLLDTAELSVFYVGSKDGERVAKSLAEAFGGKLGYGSVDYVPDVISDSREYAYSEEKMDVSQAKLSMGFVTGTGYNREDRHTAILLNEILGASPASKLFLNVREKQGLCYYCSSSYSSVSGNIMVSCGFEESNKEKVISGILAQLDAIRRGDITDAEFVAARNSLGYSYAQIYDSPFSLQAFYATRACFGINETVEECRDALMSVTREDIVRLAGKIRYDSCFFVSGNGSTSQEEVEDYE